MPIVPDRAFYTVYRVAAGEGTFIAAMTTVVLGTFTKELLNTDVILPPAGWIVDDVAGCVVFNDHNISPSVDGVAICMRRTAVANQYQIVAKGGQFGRTINWAVFASPV